jgi:hypothetical protein
MPLFLEPGQKYPIVLDCDADKPAESRPTFYAKSQSMRGQQRVGEVLDMWTNNAELTVKELFDETVAVLGEVLVGWKHMDREYSVDALRDVLMYQEARELLRKVMFNQHITADEKKSSESPPSSAAD